MHRPASVFGDKVTPHSGPGSPCHDPDQSAEIGGFSNQDYRLVYGELVIRLVEEVLLQKNVKNPG